MDTFDVAGYHVRGLLEGLRALGTDTDKLLRDCNLDRALLADPEQRFAAPLLLLLWFHAQQRYGKPSFGFDLALQIPFGKLELIDYLIALSPTVGAGFECLDHHARLCSSGVSYRICDEVHDGEAGKRIVVASGQLGIGLPPSLAEYLWTILISRVRQMCGPQFRPVLWLREKPQVSAQKLVDVLGRVPEVASEEALFVSKAQWAIANPKSDPMLQQLLLAHARDVTARLPEGDALSALRRAIVCALQRGDPSIGRVAAQLGLTTRTLQRRLEQEGLAYQELLETLRRDMALRYLERTQLSIAEISGLLAYADASAFGRAFRRWTGSTPAAHRQGRRSPLAQVESA